MSIEQQAAVIVDFIMTGFVRLEAYMGPKLQSEVLKLWENYSDNEDPEWKALHYRITEYIKKLPNDLG